MSIYRSDVFLLATTTGETQPLMIIEFLHRVYEIFEEYFGSVEETSIKENFSTVYQLLEEMMDYGYPLTTEPNALKAMITPPTVMSRLANAANMGGSNVSDVLPGGTLNALFYCLLLVLFDELSSPLFSSLSFHEGTISNHPWRKTGVKYAQNEIYMDIVEEVDAIVDRNGMVTSTEVTGVIAGNSRLSGVPDLVSHTAGLRRSN